MADETMTQSSIITATLFLVLAGAYGALLDRALARARRRKRRAVMRRHRLVLRYPGMLGMGAEDDPYLGVWAQYVERLNEP